MIKINLIPREILAKEEQKQQTTQAIISGAVIVAFLAVISFVHWYNITRLEAKLLAQKQKYEKLQEIVAKVQALDQAASAVRTRLGVVTDLLKGRPLYPYFMVDFIKTMPNGVFITNLGTRNQANNQLTITAGASASTPESISDWLRTLAGSGKFTDPGISAITVTGSEGAKAHLFTISTSYKHPNL